MTASESIQQLFEGALPSRYLVGRENLEDEILSTLLGKNQSVWLSGTRDVGKSSLGESIAVAACGKGGRVLRVECASIRNFDDLCSKIVVASQRAGVELPQSVPATEQLAVLERASRDSPIVLLFDDFDETAMCLDLDSQACLRGLAEREGCLAYLIITRLQPTQLLEEVVENSRLAGICTSIPVRPLTRMDVQDLFTRLADDLGAPEMEALGKAVWEEVGGFPRLVKDVAVFIARKRQKSRAFDGEEALGEAIDRIQDSIRLVWRSLHPGIQALLLAESPGGISEMRLREAGLLDRRGTIVKPRALVEVGRQDDHERSSKSDLQLEKWSLLQFRVYEANQAIKALTSRDGFRASHEHLTVYSLCRVPCDRSVFKDCVEYLYKLLWESTRTGSGGEASFLLPKTLQDFMVEDEAARAVSTLRNGLFHDKSKPMDARKNNPDLKKFHDVLERLCGVRMPNSVAQYQLARDELLRSVLDFLEQLCAQALNLDSNR